MKMATPELRKIIAAAIDKADKELWIINQEVGCLLLLEIEADTKWQLWKNPESMFEELRASKLLSEWLEARGWTVKRGVYGIGTTFEAKFSVKDGGRTVCYNAEYGKLFFDLTGWVEKITDISRRTPRSRPWLRT